MTRQAPKNLRIGQAGVYQVASQLLLRGYNPMFPAVDHGQDIVLNEGGIRIQVKSGEMRYGKVYPNGSYWLQLGKTTIQQRRQVWVSDIDWTSFCDFVVFWGITENRFWIIPAQLLNGHQCLTIGPKSNVHKDVDIEKMNKLLAEGKTQDEVADILGVQQMTISRRVRGQYLTTKRTFGQEVRACEDGWDQISEYLSSLQEADSALSMNLPSSPNNLTKEKI